MALSLYRIMKQVESNHGSVAHPSKGLGPLPDWIVRCVFSFSCLKLLIANESSPRDLKIAIFLRAVQLHQHEWLTVNWSSITSEAPNLQLNIDQHVTILYKQQRGRSKKSNFTAFGDILYVYTALTQVSCFLTGFWHPLDSFCFRSSQVGFLS